MGSFYERLVSDNPKLAVRYMAHLARQAGSGLDSAKWQAVDARVAGDMPRVEIACDRYDALRDKVVSIARPFFDEHVIIGNLGTAGDARDIFDVLQKEPMSREFLMRPLGPTG